MAGKYNRRKTGRSRYPERLRKRGLSSAPRMSGLVSLRKRAGVEITPDVDMIARGE